MYIVISVTLLAILLAFLESCGIVKGGMRMGFFLVTLLCAIHYDYGNDYMSYYEVFQNVVSQPFDFRAILDGDVYREPGWALLNYAFKYVGGFFMMVAVLSVIQNIIVCRFIEKEINKKWRLLSFFIYLYSTSFYLMSFTMLRQELVMIVFLGIWPWIKERKWIRCLIVLALCGFVHQSSMILIPFAFWGFVPAKNGKLIILVYLALLLGIWFNRELLEGIFEGASAFEEFDRFKDAYIDGDDNTLGMGVGFIVSYIIPLLVSVSYLIKRPNDSQMDQRRIVLLSLVSYLIMPFMQIAPLIGRVGMYFSIYQIGAIPIVYYGIKSSGLRKVLLLLFVLITLYSYFMFFVNPVWVQKYTVFKTIFSVL